MYLIRLGSYALKLKFTLLLCANINGFQLNQKTQQHIISLLIEIYSFEQMMISIKVTLLNC